MLDFSSKLIYVFYMKGSYPSTPTPLTPKEAPMTDWFNDLTKTLADEALSRRQAVRRIAGMLAGGAIAFWLPDQVFADSASKHSHVCKHPGTCSTNYPNCGHNQYGNCYCFQSVGTGKGVCACNGYCACDSGGRQQCGCSRQSDCGKGYACVTNTGCGCTEMTICLQLCTKTCQLDANRSGRTAAGV